MQLHFVMQLQLKEAGRLDELNELKVENGEVRFVGTTIAHINNLSFVAHNEDYQQKREELIDLRTSLEKARILKEKYTNDDVLNREYQRLLDKEKKLRMELTQHQNLLLDTAKRIAMLQGEAISDRTRRAIDAFERGNIKEANIILDEAEKDGDYRFAEFEKKEELREKDLYNIYKDIESLLLKVKTVMADVLDSIEKRKTKAMECFQKAEYRARSTSYNKEKYLELLQDFMSFLIKYSYYNEAEEIAKQQIEIADKLYGNDSFEMAVIYIKTSCIYLLKRDDDKAKKLLEKSMKILIKDNIKDNFQYLAETYDNLGTIYWHKGEFQSAWSFHKKAAKMFEETYGTDNLHTAISYNNIGTDYYDYGDFNSALRYYNKSLKIKERICIDDKTPIAFAYSNVGLVYRQKGNFKKALDHYKKALKIRQDELGEIHPDTASSYNNIGEIYRREKIFEKALFYHIKAMKIREEKLGTKHVSTGTSYNNVGYVYLEQGKPKLALDFFLKDEKICEEHSTDHPYTATSYRNIGEAYFAMGEYEKSINYLKRALEIYTNKLKPNNKDIVETKALIAKVMVKKNEEATHDTTQRTTQKTTQKIVEAIMSNPNISIEELALICGLTRDGINYHIRNLKKQGVLRRVGPDNGGHWDVITPIHSNSINPNYH